MPTNITEYKVDSQYNYDYVLKRLGNDPLFIIEDKQISFYYNDFVHKITYQSDKFLIESNDIEIVKKVLSLNEAKDISDLYANTKFANITKKYKGVPIVKDISCEVSLLRNIIHQQVSMKAAYTLTKRLIKYTNNIVDGYYIFPTAKVISRIPLQDLIDLKINRTKAKTLKNIARAISMGVIDFDLLGTKSPDEIIEYLSKFKGIGRWTVNCLLFFGYGFDNLFLYTDLGVIKAIEKIYDFDKRPTIKETKELSSDLLGYNSYITYYLWLSLGD